MLYIWFVKLKWKEATRSYIWQRNLAANIGIGMLILLMMGYLLMLGVFLDPLLQKIVPDVDPTFTFNSVILYYFLFDIVIRYLMQALPTFTIESYLHLPIKRSSIAHFILMRTGLHILNFIPLLVFIPFAISSVMRTYDAAHAFLWTLSIASLIFVNSYLATYLKRQLVSRAWIPGIAALALIGVALMDRFDILHLSSLSQLVFNTLASSNQAFMVPLAFLVLVYFVQFRFLLSRMYPDEVIRRKSHEASDFPRIKYLESMGLIGDLIVLEMKLWWRHKRTKSMIYMLPIFLLYGLFFYPNPEFKDGSGFLIFVGVFISGGLMINYMNYAFGYESNYFDGILTRRIDMRRYIQAKLTIGMLISTACFILTIPYVFFGTKILLINFATYLFNIGFLTFLLLYMATYNKQRLDMGKGASFNYQGMSMMNWLVMLPAFLLPVLIYAPFKFFGYPYTGIAMIGVVGIIGIIFRKSLIEKITRNFFTRKYNMAEGFRSH